MSEAPRKKIKRPTAAARVALPPPMDPGDLVEIGITVEIRHPRKGNIWVKAGATGTIRDNETPLDARARILGFVTDTADATVKEYLDA